VSRLEAVEGVAIERPDGPVVEALLESGLPVVVIASSHVKALRTRHGLAGDKDDRADAYVLTDALRTDGHRDNRPACRRVGAQGPRRSPHRAGRAADGPPGARLPGAVGLFDELAAGSCGRT
jgi:hypothetical protein